MVTFRNNKNYSRRRYRSNDRNFRRSGDNVKFKSDFSTNITFQRKTPGRNNHNASKLIEKYTDLAREALAHEDKILSENYFQHADHFTRILNEKENNNHPKQVDDVDKNKTTSELKDNKEEDKKIVNN